MQGYLILNCVEKYNGDYRTYNYVFDNMTELIKKKDQFIENFKSTYSFKELITEASSESRYVACDSDGLVFKITITNQHTINVCGATIVDDDFVESILEKEGKTTIKGELNAIKESKKYTWPDAGGEQ